MARKQRTPGGPFAPVNFTEKHLSKFISRAVFWSLHGYNEPKLPKPPFRALRGLLFQVQNVSFKSFLSYRLLFFCFSCPIFFFCLAFTRLHFGGKAFRIVGFDMGGSGQWNKISSEFSGQRYAGFAFSQVSSTESCSF